MDSFSAVSLELVLNPYSDASLLHSVWKEYRTHLDAVSCSIIKVSIIGFVARCISFIKKMVFQNYILNLIRKIAITEHTKTMLALFYDVSNAFKLKTPLHDPCDTSENMQLIMTAIEASYSLHPSTISKKVASKHILQHISKQWDSGTDAFDFGKAFDGFAKTLNKRDVIETSCLVMTTLSRNKSATTTGLQSEHLQTCVRDWILKSEMMSANLSDPILCSFHPWLVSELVLYCPILLTRVLELIQLHLSHIHDFLTLRHYQSGSSNKNMDYNSSDIMEWVFMVLLIAYYQAGNALKTEIRSRFVLFVETISCDYQIDDMHTESCYDYSSKEVWRNFFSFMNVRN